MGLTKQLYDSYVLDGSMEINYYEKISYMRGLDKPKKNKRSLKIWARKVLIGYNHERVSVSSLER